MFLKSDTQVHGLIKSLLWVTIIIMKSITGEITAFAIINGTSDILP